MRHRVEVMTFGELLRRYRTRAQLTQEALAEKAGLSRRGIADLERGARRSPYRHTMRQLANSLGLLEPEREAMFAAGRRVDASRANRKGTRPLVRLPEPISNFVGREHAREEVTSHLGQARLVTLVLSKELGEVRNVAVCLESLAVLESAGRQFDRAARLFGAADALRAAMGAGRRQWLQADHERAVEATRTALGEPAFAAAWSDRHHHSLDGAVAIALGGRETRLQAQSPRRSGHLDALTRRELEVAHRVAEGLTNRQIGAALVITEGTASLHVKRVLHKLGFRSRAQITSWILREVSPVDAPGVSTSEDIPCR